MSSSTLELMPPDEPIEVAAPPPPRVSREVRLLGLLLLALAAILRFVALGHREVFGAEFTTLDVVTGRLTRMFPESIFHGHLPLYLWVMSIWDTLTGSVSNPAYREWLLRLPSAVFGLTAVLVIIFHAHRYLRRTAFLIAVLAFALSPELVATSRDATPWALLALAAALSHHLGVRALDEGGVRRWVPFALVTLLGALVHPFFWFLTAGQFVFALAHARRMPRPFVLIAAAGLGLLLIAGITAAIYAARIYPSFIEFSSLPIDDLLKALVTAAMGDFKRYETRIFVRVMLYLILLVALGLSVAYWKIRSLEAQALPEHIGFIDQTQDVVGNWRRLTLPSYLSYQWATLLIPAIGILILGALAPKYDIRAHELLVCLPSVAVLLGTGVDFVPRLWGKLALALMLIVALAWYDLQVMIDRGYGVKHAFTNVLPKRDFTPEQDVLVYATRTALDRPVSLYKPADLSPIGLGAPGSLEEADEIRTRALSAAQGRPRVFALLYNDTRQINKVPQRPVREAYSPENGWIPDDDKYDLSPPEGSELRIYNRAADTATTGTSS